MLNREILDALPAVANRFEVELEDSEKVVFAAEMRTFGDEKDGMLGTQGSKFTLTNRRIVADNGLGVWTVQIPDNLASCEMVTKKWLMFTSVYFLVMLNSDIVYDDGKGRLNGFRFYFDKKDTARLAELLV